MGQARQLTTALVNRRMGRELRSINSDAVPLRAGVFSKPSCVNDVRLTYPLGKLHPVAKPCPPENVDPDPRAPAELLQPT
jgi:hypothetical protein